MDEIVKSQALDLMEKMPPDFVEEVFRAQIQRPSYVLNGLRFPFPSLPSPSLPSPSLPILRLRNSEICRKICHLLIFTTLLKVTKL